jgi:hypothetical protein
MTDPDGANHHAEQHPPCAAVCPTPIDAIIKVVRRSFIFIRLQRIANSFDDRMNIFQVARQDTGIIYLYVRAGRGNSDRKEN